MLNPIKMKKLITLGLALFITHQLSSQSCNEYFPLEDGTRWVMETFNHKNKFQSKSEQKVEDTKSVADGFEARMTGQISDDKGKNIGAIDYQVKCEGDYFYVSMNSMLSPEQMGAYQDMDIEVDGDFLELPAVLETGMGLKDAAIEVKVQNGGFPIMTMNIEIYERTVAGFESVTTPAGTFDCVKIAFKARTKMGKAIPIKVNFTGAEWFAKGTGLVKSESYDKKDKLSTYTLLTEFSK